MLIWIKRAIAVLICFILPYTAVSCKRQQTDQQIHTITSFDFSNQEPLKQEPENHRGISNMELVAQNNGTRLYMNKSNMDFAVQSGETIWYSSPVCASDSDDKLSNEYRSLITVEVENSGKKTHYNSYDHCVKNGMFMCTPVKNGMKIQMSIGQPKKITQLDLPHVIEKDKFEKLILNKLDSQSKIQSKYKLYSRKDKERLQAVWNTVAAQYPIINQKDVYIICNGIPDFLAKDLKDILDSIGYDDQQIQQDHEENQVDIEIVPLIRFDLELTLTLEEGRLKAYLDCSRLKKIQNYNLTELSLLKHFGASYLPQDKGYMLFPDGSGSIVNIDGSTSNYATAPIRIYGDDAAVAKPQRVVTIEQAMFPVFGINKNSIGYIAIIEKGESIASVQSNLKGILPISNPYASFTITTMNRVDAGYSNTSEKVIVDMAQKEIYRSVIEMQYIFLDNANLGNMSEKVRTYYREKGLLQKKSKSSQSGNIPLNLDMVASIDKNSSILGLFPTRKNVGLTDVKAVEKITDNVYNNITENIVLRYSYWANNGYYQKAANYLSVQRCIGGEKAFQDLYRQLLKRGIDFYPSLGYLTVKNTSGFNKKKYAARTLGDTIAPIYQYDMATGNSFTYRIGVLVAPDYIDTYTDLFLKSMKKLRISHVAFEDFGRVLYSDLRMNGGVTREQVKHKVIDNFKKLSDLNVMLDAPNVYALPYASIISNVPIDSSRYKREEYAVPFVQMVLHGTIDYFSKPINSSYNYKYAMLRNISFAAYPSFKIMDKDTVSLLGTYLIEETSISFDDWKGVIASYYQRANSTLSAVKDSIMTHYSLIEEDLFETKYDNGKSILVNYSEKEKKYQNTIIPPEDWVLIGGSSR